MLGDGRHGADGLPVVQDGEAVVEEDGGDIGVPGQGLVALQHAVEAPDGVLFQPVHGAGAIQDKDQFSQIIAHGLRPPSFDGSSIPSAEGQKVA